LNLKSRDLATVSLSLFGLHFFEVQGFFGWKNIKNNREIQKLSYKLGFGGRLAQSYEIFLLWHPPT
jgi:hypothetical protein